jgi:CubicO group peptidase (beta-lactamase class C family)
MSELKSAIGLILNGNKISNASIAIIQDGFDFRDNLREDNSPQSDKSKYLIYSIAKVYIAALIMRLSDQKRIEIDNPVNSWFPEIQGLDGITVRHLLNHHSGMPDYGPTRAYLKAIIAKRPAQPTWPEILLF